MTGFFLGTIGHEIPTDHTGDSTYYRRMPVRILSSDDDLQTYQAWAISHPQGNLWQSVEWMKYQQAQGKEVRIYAHEERTVNSEKYQATALVIIDRTVGGYSTWEISRGPLWNSLEGLMSLFDHITADAKKELCLALYLSPYLELTTHHSKLKTSARHIQPEATRVIDVTQSEEEILAQMHPKGRYNISLAKKHDIDVAEGSDKDIDAFYELLKGTGGRDGFRIFQESHYARFLRDLKGSFLLMATHEHTPIAGLMGVEWNGTAIYYYGASSYEHRHLMAPYLLQWEAIRRAKANGCKAYDLLGISPENAPTNDPWKGITDFKRKFGGTVVAYPSEQMVVLRPGLKLALEWKRVLLG